MESVYGTLCGSVLALNTALRQALTESPKKKNNKTASITKYLKSLSLIPAPVSHFPAEFSYWFQISLEALWRR